MKEAEKQYKLVLKIDPNDVATHTNYGHFLYKMVVLKNLKYSISWL